MKVILLVFSLLFISSQAHCYEIQNLFHGHHARHEYKIEKKKVLKITAYTASKKENGRHSLTASNTKLKPGIIAISRDLLQAGWNFGDKVYIADLGVFEIRDTMAKRMRNSADIFMHRKDDADDFGVQKLEVALLAKN